MERVLWAAADGGWAVIRVKTATGPVLVVGPLGTVAALETEQPFASFEGAYEQHPTHGWQFKATGVLLSSPRTAEGIRMYLASSGVKGIGAAMAARIVDHFGLETTAILETSPERLAEVPGIGAAKAEGLAEAWRADAGGRALSILLRGLGLSARLAARIRERFGDDAWRVVTTEPYRLAEEVRGIGFQIADRLALAQGLPADPPDRQEAAARHVVQRATEEGHTHLPAQLVADGLKRLDVPVPDVGAVLDRLVGGRRLREVGEPDARAVAVPDVADAEERIAVQLALRSAAAPAGDAATLLADAERFAGLVLDDTQRAAVLAAATRPVSVITGGPGTGKTTLVRVLLRVAAQRGETWALASPTGRAEQAARRGHRPRGVHAAPPARVPARHRPLRPQRREPAGGRRPRRRRDVDGRRAPARRAARRGARAPASSSSATPTSSRRSRARCCATWSTATSSRWSPRSRSAAAPASSPSSRCSGTPCATASPGGPTRSGSSPWAAPSPTCRTPASCATPVRSWP